MQFCLLATKISQKADVLKTLGEIATDFINFATLLSVSRYSLSNKRESELIQRDFFV